jgi:hypothetical protein
MYKVSPGPSLLRATVQSAMHHVLLR